MIARVAQRLAVCLVLCASVAAIAAGPAGAATIPASASGISSARIVGDQIVWFQRVTTFKIRRNGWPVAHSDPGAVFARPLAGGAVRRVFKPAAGQRIVGFKADGGRIAVGLATRKRGDGPTSVSLLVPNTAEWTLQGLVARDNAVSGGNCGSRVSLVDVRADGAVLVDDQQTSGATGACTMVRVKSTLRAFGTGGETTLSPRTSGWATGTERPLIPTLLGGAGDWYMQSAGEPDFGWSVDGAMNVVTGERKQLLADEDSVDRIERSTGGQLLLRDGYWSDAEFALVKNPSDPSSITRLRGARSNISWFHFCGADLLEITRNSRSRGKPWRLVVRSADGTLLRRLGATVPRGTLFDTCDAERIVFHKPLRKNRARQWVVPLTQ